MTFNLTHSLSHKIVFEVFQPVWSQITIRERYFNRHTERRFRYMALHSIVRQKHTLSNLSYTCRSKWTPRSCLRNSYSGASIYNKIFPCSRSGQGKWGNRYHYLCRQKWP